MTKEELVETIVKLEWDAFDKVGEQTARMIEIHFLLCEKAST